MDTFSHLFIVKLECLFETTKINEKEAGMAHFKKRFLSPKVFRASVCRDVSDSDGRSVVHRVRCRVQLDRRRDQGQEAQFLAPNSKWRGQFPPGLAIFS